MTTPLRFFHCSCVPRILTRSVATITSKPIRKPSAPKADSNAEYVRVFSTAEGYHLKQLLQKLPGSKYLAEEVLYLQDYPSKQSLSGNHSISQLNEIFIFSSGSVVTWGLSPSEGDRFVSEMIRMPEIEKSRFEERETEELPLVIQENKFPHHTLLGLTKRCAHISNDKIHISQSTSTFVRLAYSQGLARSAKLAVLETRLEKYLESVSTVPKSLSQGKINFSRKEILMKIGQLMDFRQSLNYNEHNFLELPEIYWNNPELEKYFEEMAQALDIYPRIRIFNTKINYASEVQSTLREVLNENTGHRLEWIIIWLIAVEVLLALGRHWDEYTEQELKEAKVSNNIETMNT
ncbi:MIOREX complex component 10 [Neolecta irregularis DAH-3]|uniref:MIOREX complex component 10 n=1 Tax=Neolecta irregularis (strain DAH-3) TaxID=1198029 RepID=A0A1U7LKY7_NEOID|nr:MIOREX complex component 10 [Neolecta irregularis DAH-3]|eukprot:OLL23314.1 MIOREX complex component 10 [Neolecta irregularis DAH-3]